MARLSDPTGHEPLSNEAQRVFDALIDDRGHLGEIWRVMLHHPTLAEKVGQLGTYLRFHATLPDDVREVTILRTAFHASSAYEQYFHERRARMAGLSEAQIDALRLGQPFPGGTLLQHAAIEVVDALVEHRSIPEAAQSAVIGAHGHEGIIELATLCGYYRMIAGIIAGFDMVVPDTPATDG
jgi:4-carboxymuconolactone decarboxylase